MIITFPRFVLRFVLATENREQEEERRRGEEHSQTHTVELMQV